jgi:hypothetical protein
VGFGSGRRKTCCSRGILRKQHLKNLLPNPLFAPAAVMIHDGLPRFEVCGQVSPGARRARDPQHSFDVPAPLVCRVSGISDLVTFAQGLEKEGSALHAALTLIYSDGPVEWNITKLKYIKRSMY